MIYVVLLQVGIVKIGYTRNMPQRFSSIMTYVPRPEVVALFHGGPRDEEELHVHLWQCGAHIRGELFAVDPELLAMCASLHDPDLDQVVTETLTMLERRTADDGAHMRLCGRRWV